MGFVKSSDEVVNRLQTRSDGLASCFTRGAGFVYVSQLSTSAVPKPVKELWDAKS